MRSSDIPCLYVYLILNNSICHHFVELHELHPNVSHILAQVEGLPKGDVANEIASEIEDGLIKDVRRILFDTANKIYLKSLEDTNIKDMPALTLKYRRNGFISRNNVKDMVRLILYIAALDSKFPKDVVADGRAVSHKINTEKIQQRKTTVRPKTSQQNQQAASPSHSSCQRIDTQSATHSPSPASTNNTMTSHGNDDPKSKRSIIYFHNLSWPRVKSLS